jgi:hypothetical protein
MDAHPMTKPSKYCNKRTMVDGIAFHSVAEARRWSELLLLEKAGEVRNVRRQVAFVLYAITGQGICKYVADFLYHDRDGNEIIEDVKGVRTSEYRIKKKWMAAQGYHITEIGEQRKKRVKLKVAA